jgi:NADH-quinone oxidoreductase subunit N
MSERVVAAAGIGMVLIGVFFKLGAVPFHFWAPDVYQGAPTPVTVYMATVVKAVAVSMALRLLWGAFGSEVVAGWWVGFVWTVAVLTMVVGNLVAVRQRNVKRMLAYSSIAHVGYIAAGLLTSTEQYGGGAAILFYLIVYSIATIGALTLVMVVTGDRVNEPDADDLALFSGLNTRHPWLAAAMTLFLLSLAGLPPGVAGLIGKLFLFSSIVKGEFLGLAVIGGLCSAISCYYYLRVVMEMYVKPPSENVASGSYPRRAGANLIILVMTILSLAIGLFPGRIYDRGQIVLNSVFGD